MMDFEWDDVKASQNLKKRGVSFLEATEVFGDEYSSCVRDLDHFGAAHDPPRA